MRPLLVSSPWPDFAYIRQLGGPLPSRTTAVWMSMIPALVGLLLGLTPLSYSYDEASRLATSSESSRNQPSAPGEGHETTSEQEIIRSGPVTRHSLVPNAELVATRGVSSLTRHGIDVAEVRLSGNSQQTSGRADQDRRGRSSLPEFPIDDARHHGGRQSDS